MMLLILAKLCSCLFSLKAFQFVNPHFWNFLNMEKLFILQYEGERSALSRKEKYYNGNDRQHGHYISHNQMSVGQIGSHVVSNPRNDNKVVLKDLLMTKGAYPSYMEEKSHQDSKTDKHNTFIDKETASADSEVVPNDDVDEPLMEKVASSEHLELHERLIRVYDKVLVVDTIPAAREVVRLLTTQYKDLVHACDTEACVGLL